MSDYKDDFFEGKRPWSVIKDQVLSSYMSPYLAKVKSLGKPILLIDGFAGPGIFDDRSLGSPLVMCQAAEKYAKGNYRAFFFNKKARFHEELTGVLEKEGWLGAAKPILGDTTQILPQIPSLLRDQTVFLYLDPFGPTGCPYSLIEPFLTRNIRYSTEIVIMMHMPIAHRLAARNAVETGRADESLIQTYHQTMKNIFGGDYWKPIMFASDLSAEQREFQLIEAYCAKLAAHLPYTGYCPVREGENKRIKYFIVFASRHPDAMLLMHNAMIKAYFERMHKDAYAGTLFESNSWSDMLSTDGLREAILKEVNQQPGITRERLWLKVVQNHFMRYQQSDFRNAVQDLVDAKIFNCPTPRKTKRLNHTCTFYPS
ncbi:MAG: three-Cys-motif partner protein TcmP [Caldilineaceae bacterium]